MKDVAAIVLAAGKGTRMKSTTTNKVALKLIDRPIIYHSVKNLKKAGLDHIVVVVGFAKESVFAAIDDNVQFAEQKKRLGTGHAVKVGLSKIDASVKHVISVYGDDSAFYPPELIKQLITHHVLSQSAITVLTIMKDNPTGLGRIIRDNQGNFQAIVEEKVATRDQKQITEINTGLYCFDRQFLQKNIAKIKKNPVSQEYYLTDIIAIAAAQNKKVEALLWKDNSVWFGINQPLEWQQAKELMLTKTMS